MLITIPIDILRVTKLKKKNSQQHALPSLALLPENSSIGQSMKYFGA